MYILFDAFSTAFQHYQDAEDLNILLLKITFNVNRQIKVMACLKKGKGKKKTVEE